ncbi:hypothetical protein Gotur_013732 [Gossypium turneri]
MQQNRRLSGYLRRVPQL